MRIDVYLTPFFLEKELMFANSYVVLIDVLRASSSIAAALYNNAKEIITTDTTEKAISIYNNLDKEHRFLAGERNCIKPEGFDAGNSPSEFIYEKVNNKTVIITTTNGTKIFAKAKEAKRRIIASFVNFNIVLNDLLNSIQKNQFETFYFLCAGTNGRLTYEDSLCTGAYISNIIKKYPDLSLTDSAQTAMDLYEIYKHNLIDFIKTREHSQKLINLNLESDVDDCLTFDKYPVLPILIGNKVIKEN